RDDHSHDVSPALGLAYQASGQEQFLPAGHLHRALGLASTGAQPAAGVEPLPPFAPVGVTEGEDVAYVGADRPVWGNPGEPGRGPVDAQHPPRAVDHDDAVGEIVDGDRARATRERLTGFFSLHDPASSTYIADNSGFPACRGSLTFPVGPGQRHTNTPRRRSPD